MVKACEVLRVARRYSSLSSSVAAILVVGLFTSPAVNALQSQNPIQSLKDAWKQAKQQVEQQQRGQQPQQQRPAQTNNRNNAPAAMPGAKKLPPSSAKVEPSLMAASESGLQFYISNPGGHVAAIAHRGSRVEVVLDGVDGPKFDDIVEVDGTGNNKVEFSPDGNRYGYVGRSGNEDVIMVDGKEVKRFDEASTVLKAGSFNGHAIGFTSNSKHFYFILHPNSTNGHESEKANFYWDGVPGPIWADQAVISPDGDHYTYYLRQPNPNGETDTLIVDGKPAGYLASNPQFTFDGKHLITQNSYSRPQPYEEVLLDGKPIMKANGMQIYMPPATYNFLAVLGTGINGNDRFLVYGGKKIEGSECRGSGGYENVAFSPDGKHWAARCNSRPGFHFAVADGKKGLEYQDISAFAFTADGTVVYSATQGAQHFVVLGSDESEAYDNVVSPGNMSITAEPMVVGNHVGYVTYTPGLGVFVMHVDGKSFKSRAAGNLQFSPDGKHYAFVSTPLNGSGSKLVLDGVEQPGTFSPMQQMTQDKGDRQQMFVFSPDSNHIAWWGIGPDQQTWGIYLDGKMMPSGEPNVSPLHLSFTADSKHIVYQSIVRTQEQTFPVFVDGRVTNSAVDFNPSLLQSSSTWHLNDDGSLTMFGQDQEGLKRFHITPADDTSVATITGGGGLMAKGN